MQYNFYHKFQDTLENQRKTLKVSDNEKKITLENKIDIDLFRCNTLVLTNFIKRDLKIGLNFH
jgi:hypothetical protein